MMDCKQPGLRELPPPPSRKLEMVVISNQTFRSNVLNSLTLKPYWSPEFGGEVRLKLLKIRYCNIASLARGAFSNLGLQLEELDLSGNPLKTIDAFVFSGLKLKSLFLNNLPRPVIDDNAFSGVLEVNSLSLQNSGLTQLLYPALLQLTQSNFLKNLFLHGNQLSKVEASFEHIFRTLQSFELTGNPWHCDCNLLWLIQIYRLSRVNGAQMSRVHQQPTCFGPDDFTNFSFDQIALNESELYAEPYFTGSPRPLLICEVPRLEHLEVDLRQFVVDTKDSQAVLGCLIRGTPEVHISWTHHLATGQSRNVTSQAALAATPAVSSERQAFEFSRGRAPVSRWSSSLTVSRFNASDVYSCTGTNLLGNVSATIRVLWPKGANTPAVVKGAKETETEDLMGTRRSSYGLNHQLPYDQYNVLAKRFSLMDVIGAVVGTFLVTMLLFVLAYRSSRLYSYHKSKCRGHMMLTGLTGQEASKHSPGGTSSSGMASSLLRFSHPPVEQPTKAATFFDFSEQTVQTSTCTAPPPTHQSPVMRGVYKSAGLDEQTGKTQQGQRQQQQQQQQPTVAPAKQHDSGTYNSHSTVSSATANGQGAYETVYNEPNQIMYETPNDGLTGQNQSFLYQLGSHLNMQGYPILLSGTLPRGPGGAFTQVPFSLPPSQYPTYIPPPPSIQQPTLPGTSALPRIPLGSSVANGMTMPPGQEYTHSANFPATARSSVVLINTSTGVPVHNRIT
ncbi:hypothetical protein SprV_0200871300 [Sparganum proliferum]